MRLKRARLRVTPLRPWRGPLGVPPPLPPGKFESIPGHLEIDFAQSTEQADPQVSDGP